MYRDARTALDERDSAVGAILIGEALITSCERARELARTDGPEAWRAVRDAHDEFPEIWRNLDGARQVLAQRGINVTGYDELRPHARARPSTGGDDGEGDAVQIDPAALDHARRAIDALKLAVPGADWADIDQRTSRLVHAPLVQRRRHRLILAAAAVGFAFVAVSFASTLVPHRKPDRRAVLRHELDQIALQRRIKIAVLQTSLGERCDSPLAHELTKQLVMDGRGAEASQFADRYTARCGEDEDVLRWADAALP